MLLTEYIENLQNMLTEHGDLEVVYSSDDEGNDFNKIYCGPSVGHYHNREFYEPNNEDEFDYDINAICIN